MEYLNSIQFEYRGFTLLDTPELIWLSILGVIILWNSWQFFKHYRVHSIIKYKPAIPISSAHSGYIKVTGQIASEDNQELPFSGTNCCMWFSTIEAHWSETDDTTDDDGFTKSDTTYYSETVFNRMSDTKWIQIQDKTGVINFDSSGDITNMSEDEWRQNTLTTEQSMLVEDDAKYEYYIFKEYWLNQGEPATAVGQMLSEYDGEDKYLFLVPPKMKSKPYLLSAMDDEELDKQNKKAYTSNFIWLSIGFLFVIDTAFLNSIIAKWIIFIVAKFLVFLGDVISYIFSLF